MDFPYGNMDFGFIRRRKKVYVDRTAYIRTLETLGEALVFLRPRRFGKSLWLDTLATYYDLARRDEFDALFGGLDIAEEPTPDQGAYVIVRWDFSTVRPYGSIDDIAEALRSQVRDQALEVGARYRDLLSGPIEVDGDTTSIIRSLFSTIALSGHRAYLLIDEYDNFVNEVLAQDVVTYRALMDNHGPFKQLFKSVKAQTRSQGGLERIFITGVAPIVLNDLTSGFNIAADVSQKPQLASLCGFTADEVRGLLGQVAQARNLPDGDVERLAQTMQTWYNGYRFLEETPDLVYNPTSTLYFLRDLAQLGTPPKELYDPNLNTDQAKLTFIARHDAVTSVFTGLAEQGGTSKRIHIARSFSEHDLTTGLDEDGRIVSSLLFYLGLVTRGTDAPDRLRIPNLAIRKLLLDRLLVHYELKPNDVHTGQEAAAHLFETGDLTPFLAFLNEKLLPVLSNRDRKDANELTLKALVFATLFDDLNYETLSELEVNKGYADLFFRRRFGARGRKFDALFELKWVRRKALGMTGHDLRTRSEAELYTLPLVKSAFDDARTQLDRYTAALEERLGPKLDLRCFSVVALDLDRALGQEVLL